MPPEGNLGMAHLLASARLCSSASGHRLPSLGDKNLEQTPG